MTQSMYDKYGGFETISKIVHGLYEKIEASETLQAYFKNVDMQRLMHHQTIFFSSIMGGPIKYDHQQLKKIHAPFNISQAAFTEVIELLEEVLEDFQVIQDDIDTLLTLVKDTQPQIVQK